MFRRPMFSFCREEEKSGSGNPVPIVEKTEEQKRESIAEKGAKIGKDEMKGASESSVHALLDEVRALRADLSGGMFSKQSDKAAKPPDANAAAKGFLDSVLDFDFMG